MNQTERIRKIMETQGVDEQEARFIMGLADGEIDGAILDGVPLDDAPTLGDVVRNDGLA